MNQLSRYIQLLFVKHQATLCVEECHMSPNYNNQTNRVARRCSNEWWKPIELVPCVSINIINISFPHHIFTPFLFPLTTPSLFLILMFDPYQSWNARLFVPSWTVCIWLTERRRKLLELNNYQSVWCVFHNYHPFGVCLNQQQLILWLFEKHPADQSLQGSENLHLFDLWAT